MKALPFIAAFALLSVSAPAAVAAEVEDADAAKVANCTFVKDVSASTTGKKGYTRSVMAAAMSDAREDAAKAGATHIVWNKVNAANVTAVSGKAYRCSK
jgi:hypothetical protein